MKNNLSQAAIFLLLLFTLSLAGFAQEPVEPSAPGDGSEIEALQGADIVIGLEPAVSEPPAVNVPLPESATLDDLANDNGTGVVLQFPASPGETAELTYTVLIGESAGGPWTPVAEFTADTTWKEDEGHFFPAFYWFEKGRDGKTIHAVPIRNLGENVPLETGKQYFVKLQSALGGTTAEYPEVLSATPRENWFDTSKTNMLILAVLFGATVLYFIARARRDPNLFIRKINGLDAVDEAIGRATEMGKPILYLNGMSTLADLSTLAALNILGRVARRVANYESTLVVPCRDPIVLTVAQEIVKAGYADAGRPDAYNEDNIFFLTEDQFSYAAAVCGIMMRDKPAANFFMGYYYAESLILAETGANTGAIQIAGTDAATQIAFFVTTCDYTLIGEELYAASAYLSREPLVLGSLKGQDMAKLFMMIVIVIGTLLVTFGMHFIKDLFKALG